MGADPVAITAVVAAGGSVVAAATPYILSHRKTQQAKSISVAENWSELTQRLQEEVDRLHRELARQKADYEAQIGVLRDSVATLRATLRGDPP